MALMAVLAGALGACTLEPLDLERLGCPCVAPYVCNEVTRVCEWGAIDGGEDDAAPEDAAPEDAGPEDAVPDDVAPEDAAPEDAAPEDAAPDDAAQEDAAPPTCGLANGASELFTDEFETDLSLWTPYIIWGGCVWSVVGGELLVDTGCTSSFVYAPSTAGLTDYRIVSRMHADSMSNVNGAVEIAWRTTLGATDAERSQYHCNWEPGTGRLMMQLDQAGGTAVISMVTVALPGTYQMTDWVTMELRAEGGDFACRICEIAGAEISAHDTTFMTGTIALKNWGSAGAYDFVRVYTVP